jgi:conjugative relaxase-like TrwC/TraI family protein
VLDIPAEPARMGAMAAGWKKLKVGEGHSAEAAVSYLADPQARGDYYTEGGAFMRWLATPRARTHLALGDSVSRVTLAALLSGRHPVDGQLIKRYGPDGTLVGGIDLTLSPAPKSVSILWALGDDSLRAELEELVLLSVNAAVGRMLDEVPLVRQRYGPGPRDVRHVRAGDWVGVQALHTTARLSGGEDIPDPQLHVHNVLMGSLDDAGQLRAIDTYAISLYRSELDAEASADLAERLRQRGWTIERRLVRGRSGAVKRVAWEVAGVPSRLVREMSSRREEVEELRQQYRQATGREPAGPSWERYLEEHRGPKARRTEYEMYAAWQEKAAEFEFTPEQVAALLQAATSAAAAGVGECAKHGEAAEQLKREILADLCRTHALVPERELNKLAMQRAMGLMDPYEAMRVVAQMFGDGDLLASTDGRVTTLEVLAAEQRATAAAERLLDAPPSRPADPSELEREFRRVEEEGRPFDERQRHAVALATSGTRFVSITGPAGTGKGHASRAMAAIWQRQGRRVIAAAVAGRTAQQAEADSAADQSYTLDGLAAGLDNGVLRLDGDDVLLVDEAGMIDHHRYARLLEAVADSGATLVQVGDDRQLAPVEAGGLWTVIHEMAETCGQAAELRTIRRARDPREAPAWTDLREGRVEEALTWYRDQSRLQLYDTRRELLAGLVEAWWASNAHGVMVVDSSNEERDRLNRMAQQRRMAAGELGTEALELDNGREIRAHDRVLFSAVYRPTGELGARRRARRVENGTAATVVGIDASAGTAIVRLHEPNRDRSTQVDRELVVPTTAPLELAYARHVYKAQGMTAEVADVATGLRTRRNELYTMITRSRTGTRLHALRTELEAMGADASNFEPPSTACDPGAAATQPHEEEDLLAQLRAKHSAAAAPRQLADHLLAAERAASEREREVEYATIGEIAKSAERSSVKQAVGHRSWHAPSRHYAVCDQSAADRTARRRDRDVEAQRDLKQIALRRIDAEQRHAPELVPTRRLSIRPEWRAPMPMALPARDLMESMGRAYAQDMNTARMLAYYELADRLHVVTDPAEEAARRWLADRDAMIVVPDQEQEQRVHQAVARLQSRPAEHPEPTDAPVVARVIVAHAGYRDRLARRQAWLRENGQAARHLVEPHLTRRAYVVAPSLDRDDDLVRGLSVAGESHLLTREPRAWVQAHARKAAEQIRMSLVEKARADGLPQNSLAGLGPRGRPSPVGRAHEHELSPQTERL